MNSQEFATIRKIAAGIAKKKYTGNLYEAADLYTTGWQAIEEATAKSVAIGPVIHHRMIDHLRFLRKRHPTKIDKAISLNIHKWNEDSDLAVENTEIEESEKFDDIIKVLRPKEQQIISLYILQGLTMKQIGKIFGLTESRISYIMKDDIFPILRKQYECSNL